MNSIVEAIVNRQAQLDQEKAWLKDDWTKIRHYILPDHPDVYGGNHKETSYFSYDRYDGTALLSAQYLAGVIHVMLTSPARMFSQFTIRDEQKRRNEYNKRWFQHASRQIHSAFQRSNWNKTISQVWKYWVAIGTVGHLFEDWNGSGKFHFQTIPVNQLCVENGLNGVVDTVYREFRMTAKRIIQRWPEAAKAPDVATAAEKEPNREFDILHFVAPVQDDFPVTLTQNKFTNVYLLKNEKAILNGSETDWQGYREMPYSVPRFEEIPGSVYGTCPGRKALDDIITLNLVYELKLKGMMFAILPVLGDYGAGLYDYVKKDPLRPGQTIPLKRNGDVKPVFTGYNPEIAELQIERLRTRVNEFFFRQEVEVYPDKKYMTAYEFSSRESSVLRVLGPPVSQAEIELLDQTHMRGYHILRRQGLIDAPPAGVNEDELVVEYLSPLIRAMRLDERRALQEFMMYLREVAQQKPILLEGVEDWKALEYAADLFGIPLDLVKEEKAFKAFIEKQRQLAEDQQQAETLKTGANAYQSMARGEASMRG